MILSAADKFLNSRDSFKLVHEGGHHWVFCDSDWHVQTAGGFCNTLSVNFNSVQPDTDRHYCYKCNCEKYS